MWIAVYITDCSHLCFIVQRSLCVNTCTYKSLFFPFHRNIFFNHHHHHQRHHYCWHTHRECEYKTQPLSNIRLKRFILCVQCARCTLYILKFSCLNYCRKHLEIYIENYGTQIYQHIFPYLFICSICFAFLFFTCQRSLDSIWCVFPLFLINQQSCIWGRIQKRTVTVTEAKEK